MYICTPFWIGLEINYSLTFANNIDNIDSPKTNQLGCRGDNDINGLCPPGPNAVLMLVTRGRMGASRSDDVGKRSGLSWIPPSLETRELWQPSLGIKINLQVK